MNVDHMKMKEIPYVKYWRGKTFTYSIEKRVVEMSLKISRFYQTQLSRNKYLYRKSIIIF